MADQNPDENFDLNGQVEYLRDLAQIVADEGLSEIEIRAESLKLTLKAPNLSVAAPATLSAAPATLSAAPTVGVAPSVPTPKAAKSEESFTPVVSPMVGVFYRAPSPSDPNFVEIGDRVERGQTIGLVEAMKVFNEITAEIGGVVAQIPAQTGQLVETGQPLLLLS